MTPGGQHRWLMILRVVTVSTLLISAFAIELLFAPARTLRPLFLLAGVAFGMVLTYAFLERWLAGRRAFLYLQLSGDAVVVTGFVLITGGAESPMSFLYLLPIIVGAMLLFRTGGLVIALETWVLYAIMAITGGAWVPLRMLADVAPVREPRVLVYYLLAHMVAFVTVALLASYLSERLRSQDDELTERRDAVARLQALNENIIESINSGLITTDLRGQINFMNRGGRDITGHGPEDVLSRSVEKVFKLDQGFLLDLRKELLEDRRFRFEKWFRTNSGETIFLGIAASNLYDRIGHPLGFIFIFQDLTEIHALEQEVRLKDRMAALGEMAAGMAHELRNPLAAMSGSVQYLKSSLDPDGETLELMDIILRESHRLDQAIRDFLTFARPGKFSSERTDLVRLFQDNIKLLTKSSEFRRNHSIQTSFQEHQVVVKVDANRIKQVFWNLSTNALKAMPDGGTLHLSIETSPEDGAIRLCFQDEGQGMTPEQVDKYFEPFQSSFRQGTGLGAAIVYRLVQEHEGRIWVESDKGTGTRILIDLPGCNEPVIAQAAMNHDYAIEESEGVRL
jgi:two-component system sensor histidine kinase PilS (NtrC family)